MVPQAKLFMDYCRRTKAYLSSQRQKAVFYSSTPKQEKEKEEEFKMLYNGKMIACLAAEKGSSEIQDGLQTQISQETGRKRGKGKERAVEEEEDKRRTKARTVSPAPVEEGDNGFVNLQLFEVPMTDI